MDDNHKQLENILRIMQNTITVKQFNGVLKCAIDAHGPITYANLASASKRLLGVFKPMLTVLSSGAYLIVGKRRMHQLLLAEKLVKLIENNAGPKHIQWCVDAYNGQTVLVEAENRQHSGT